MDIVGKVIETIRKYSMLSRGDRVVVGLSGGADSVCLLRLLHKLRDEFGIELSAAYIDHGLRPAEIPGEIAFCGGLCASLGVSFHTRSVDVISYARQRGINKQEAARELRYGALEEIAAAEQATKLALGHNADDQAETMLMRLMRGTGPSGLAGIPPVRKHIIRPLIGIERDQIEEFLKAENAGYVSDSSNEEDRYLRNRIRHSLMPVIRTLYPEAVKTMGRAAAIFRDEERYFEILVTKALMKLVSRKTDTAIELFLAPLEIMDPVMFRRVLRRAIDSTKGLRGIGFVHIEDIAALIKSGKAGDRLYLPRSIRVIRGYATLHLTSDRPEKLGAYSLKAPGDLVLREAALVLRCALSEGNSAAQYGDGKTSAAFDADKAPFPLVVRPRAPGDYFHPSGFGKRKKLQDYFVDEKIPRDMRDTVPLLVSGDSIAWVAGYRSDERFRVDKETKRVLQCEIKPHTFQPGGNDR